MQLFIIVFVVFLKFFVPIFMLKFPFYGVWGNYFLDVVDGDILKLLGLSEFTYQAIDKVADLWSYVFMLVLGLRLKIRKTIVVLFVYRLVGQLLFFATRNEVVFFYFQNLLEPLLMAYTFLVWRKGSEKLGYVAYKKHLVLIWVIVVVYKVWNEWYLHLANIDLSALFFGISG